MDLLPDLPERRAAPGEERAQAVEGLRQHQPEVDALGGAEGGGKRVSSHLQDRDPAGEHEQTQEHETVHGEVGRAEHDQARPGHRRERKKNGRDGLEPRDQRGGWERDEPVGNEERERRSVDAVIFSEDANAPLQETNGEANRTEPEGVE